MGNVILASGEKGDILPPIMLVIGLLVIAIGGVITSLFIKGLAFYEFIRVENLFRIWHDEKNTKKDEETMDCGKFHPVQKRSDDSTGGVSTQSSEGINKSRENSPETTHKLI